MIYLDTSALLAFTLTSEMEPGQFAATTQLFELINTEQVKAVTSFYALHELLVIALRNTSPDWEIGSELARRALLKIFQTRLLYYPLPGREDKLINARLFSALRDATDLPHAIAAYAAGCEIIVGYDEHFRAIAEVIVYKTPDELITEFSLGGQA